MNRESINKVSELLKSMSHPIRLGILCELESGEKTVGELKEKLDTTDANLSQHLKILWNSGITGKRKDANFIYNRIADARVLELVEHLRNLFCHKEKIKKM